MGKLAMWGAVAGGAEGWQQNIERKLASEAAAIDAAREERITKLKHKQTTELESMRQEGATGRTEMEITGRKEIEDIRGWNQEQGIVLRANYQMQEAGAGREFEAEQRQLDRESRERIAKIQSGARSSGAKKALERFEPRVLSTSEANEYGIAIETDTPAIYDKAQGKWYLQQGDRLVLPGTPSERIARAPREAVKALLANPGRADIFQNEYGYLPIDYLGVLNEAAMSLYVPQQGQQ